LCKLLAVAGVLTDEASIPYTVAGLPAVACTVGNLPAVNDVSAVVGVPAVVNVPTVSDCCPFCCCVVTILPVVCMLAVTGVSTVAGEKVKLIRPTTHPFGLAQTIGPSNTCFFIVLILFFSDTCTL
jgi:hypothetical protein